ncbi:MAG TPA: hypothetical protein VE153_32645 [Myxococcus sp.]|jgi:hypothetical protein|nr:hypothetical protein [Myxococcus sp.]
MWSFEQETIAHGRGLHMTLLWGTTRASWDDAMRGCEGDASLRTALNTVLAEAPFPAFRWETPGVTAAAAAVRPFEFVLLDEPSLARPPEPEAFAEYFRAATEPVVTFSNLRRDAMLVVPRPLAEAAAYGHLAAFVRAAPPAQRDALWQAVGHAMVQRVGDVPVWLSTAGAGVSWLHVRLDDRPKYYRHAPYRTPPA